MELDRGLHLMHTFILLTSISFAHLTNIPITPIDACIYKLIVFSLVFSSFGQNDYKTLQKRSNNSRTSTIAFWYAISIIMTSLSVKIRWLRRQYYACHCSIQQFSIFFNGQIVFFVYFFHIPIDGGRLSNDLLHVYWFIENIWHLCIYLQLSLFLWHCYLYKILIFRLAIRVRLVPEVWMRLKDRRSLTFAVVSVGWVLMLKIDPYSSWPIWILLLGIYSLHKPRIPHREKFGKKDKKRNNKKYDETDLDCEFVLILMNERWNLNAH